MLNVPKSNQEADHQHAAQCPSIQMNLLLNLERCRKPCLALGQYWCTVAVLHLLRHPALLKGFHILSVSFKIATFHPLYSLNRNSASSCLACEATSFERWCFWVMVFGWGQTHTMLTCYFSWITTQRGHSSCACVSRRVYKLVFVERSRPLQLRHHLLKTGSASSSLPLIRTFVFNSSESARWYVILSNHLWSGHRCRWDQASWETHRISFFLSLVTLVHFTNWAVTGVSSSC